MLDSRSCKQPNTTLSSTEAEHSAAVEAKPPRDYLVQRVVGELGCIDDFQRLRAGLL
jgi:hypothetical protein